MNDLNRDDVKTMREQDDLRAYMRQTMQAAAAECDRRKNLVRRYPDLLERLQQIPGQRKWNGYIAPALWNGKPNDSPIRVQLIAIVAEAERRAARG